MIDVTDISKAREKITRSKIIQEQNRKKVEEVIAQIEKYEGMISEQQIARMRDRGLFVESVLNVDKDRLRREPEYVQVYLKKCQEFVSQFIEVISEVL